MDVSWIHAWPRWPGSVIMRKRERLTFSAGVEISDGKAAEHDLSRWSNLSCVFCAVIALKVARTRFPIFFNVWNGF